MAKTALTRLVLQAPQVVRRPVFFAVLSTRPATAGLLPVGAPKIPIFREIPRSFAGHDRGGRSQRRLCFGFLPHNVPCSMFNIIIRDDRFTTVAARRRAAPPRGHFPANFKFFFRAPPFLPEVSRCRPIAHDRFNRFRELFSGTAMRHRNKTVRRRKKAVVFPEFTVLYAEGGHRFDRQESIEKWTAFCNLEL